MIANRKLKNNNPSDQNPCTWTRMHSLSVHLLVIGAPKSTQRSIAMVNVDTNAKKPRPGYLPHTIAEIHNPIIKKSIKKNSPPMGTPTNKMPNPVKLASPKLKAVAPRTQMYCIYLATIVIEISLLRSYLLALGAFRYERTTEKSNDFFVKGYILKRLVHQWGYYSRNWAI